MLRSEERVADVVCEFGSANPNATTYRGDKDGCGRCAYGELAKAVGVESVSMLGRAMLSLGMPRGFLRTHPSFSEIRFPFSFPGESAGSEWPFNAESARAAWGERTVGELVEALHAVGASTAKCVPPSTKGWDFRTLESEMSETAKREERELVEVA